MCSLKGYFGVYFPHCFATQEINTKITLLWAHKQFTTPTHTLSSVFIWHVLLKWWAMGCYVDCDEYFRTYRPFLIRPNGCCVLSTAEAYHTSPVLCLLVLPSLHTCWWWMKWVGVLNLRSLIFILGHFCFSSNVSLRFVESGSYLADVTTAKLWWHLPNMNLISDK